MLKLVISNSHDVYYNLALESYLLSLKEEMLFLWINSPSVVIGYNQNSYKETDVNYLKNHNINLARRISGGGCVYHDYNNLNVSLITRNEDSMKLNNIIKDVLAKYDIESVVTSSNDLLIDDMKFSGQASYSDNDMYLYHSCVLVDVDLSVLSKAITPSKIKLETHAIDSVRKRVVNLKTIVPTIEIHELMSKFKELEYVSEEKVKIDEEKVQKIREKYSSEYYIYSNNPKFKTREEKLINNDIFDIELEIDENKIKSLNIYSDSPRVFNFNKIINSYLDVEFKNEETIENIVSEIKKLY